MHTNNLVAVKDIAPVPTPDNASETEKTLDTHFAQELERLFILREQDPDNYWIQAKIEECNLLRNRFSREISYKVSEIMEPTNENTDNLDYLKFYNVEEEYQVRFDEGKTDCVKFADGRIRPAALSRFKIINGQVYQNSAGRLKHPMRTKKAKRMKALPDYPIKKAFKSLSEYLEYLGYIFDEEHQAYGCYENPYGYWDYYNIGGRWPEAFLIPETCHEYSVGNINVRDRDRLKAPAGYQWVAAARKKDINWKLMHKEHLKWSMKQFRDYREYFSQKKLPHYSRFRITDKGIEDFDEVLYIDGESMYENFIRRSIITGTEYEACFYGFLDGSKWVCRESNREAANGYIKKLDEFIASLDGETVLAAVDCHS